MESIDGRRVRGALSLSLPHETGLSPYDRITFDAILSPNERDYDTYRKSRGILFSANAEEISILGTHRKDLRYITCLLQKKLADFFDRCIGGDAAGFAMALLTGCREKLSGQTALAFRRLGISHLLAVSGLHLSVLVGGADFLLKKATVSKKKRVFLLLLLMALFVTVCGFSTSVMRASLMLTLLTLSELAGEMHDSVTALFVSVAVILALRPLAVYDAGLWLSFSATLGILLVSPLIRTLTQKKKGLCRLWRLSLVLLLISVTALFFTLPVIYLLEGSISLIAPLANLIFVPITELLLYLLVILLPLSWIPYLPYLLGSVIGWVMTHTAGIAEKLSALRGICISLRYPFVGALVVLFLILTLAVLFVGRFRPVRLLALFLAMSVAFAGAFFLYRGATSGDVNVFLCHNGKNEAVGFIAEDISVLVDITAGGSQLPNEAIDTLTEHCASEIDLYILTHLHKNHISSLPKLLDRIKIRRLLLPSAETESDSEIASAIVASLSDICRIDFYPREDSYLTYGTLRLDLPRYETIARSEHPVVVFSAAFGDKNRSTLVYAGAAAFENPFTATLTRDADFVMVGSHGPVTKNVIPRDAFARTEQILFTQNELMLYADTAGLAADIHVLDEKKPCCHILFTD